MFATETKKMGVFDTVIATVTCPHCNESYLHEDIQTKSFVRGLYEIYENDDTRYLKGNPMLPGRPNAFAGIKNMDFPCYTHCYICDSELYIICKIRKYILTKAQVTRIDRRTVGMKNPYVLDLSAKSKSAAEMGFLRK